VHKAVIDLSSKCTKKGMAYVALSRVKTLDGLAIKGLDVSKLLDMAPVDEDALKEIERLRATLAVDVEMNDVIEPEEEDMEVDENEIDADEPSDTNCVIN
jgi:hypothetical protein